MKGGERRYIVAKEFILCVDDDRTILMSLKAQLRHLFGTAYCYEVAQSAAEAWEIINEIYEDIAMPNII